MRSCRIDSEERKILGEYPRLESRLDRRRTWTNEEIEWAKELRASGKTYRAIAEELGNKTLVSVAYQLLPEQKKERLRVRKRTYASIKWHTDPVYREKHRKYSNSSVKYRTQVNPEYRKFGLKIKKVFKQHRAP